MTNNSIFLLGCVAALSACPPKTDYNRPCQMPRRTDAGVAYLTEKEVRQRTGTGSDATRDFIAFGATSCEDLVCVRDATFTSDAGDNDVALGYCSNHCDLGTPCPSYRPDFDERGDMKLNCRALLLDEQTLEVINLNNIKSPYFCARGSAPDAGM